MAQPLVSVSHLQKADSHHRAGHGGAARGSLFLPAHEQQRQDQRHSNGCTGQAMCTHIIVTCPLMQRGPHHAPAAQPATLGTQRLSTSAHV